MLHLSFQIKALDHVKNLYTDGRGRLFRPRLRRGTAAIIIIISSIVISSNSSSSSSSSSST